MNAQHNVQQHVINDETGESRHLYLRVCIDTESDW